MENKNPQLEGYQKILMYLAGLCMLIYCVLSLLWAFEVAKFPIFLAFVPQLFANLLVTVALWKRVTKPVRIALIMSIPLLLACAVVLQMNI